MSGKDTGAIQGGWMQDRQPEAVPANLTPDDWRVLEGSLLATIEAMSNGDFPSSIFGTRPDEEIPAGMLPEWAERNEEYGDYHPRVEVAAVRFVFAKLFPQTSGVFIAGE